MNMSEEKKWSPREKEIKPSTTERRLVNCNIHYGRKAVYRWVLLGIVLALAGVLTPVHEFGHYLCGGELVAWNRVEFPGGATATGIFAGFALELLFSVVMASLFLAMFRRTGKTVFARCVGTFLGYSLALVFIAWGSTDFNVHILVTGVSPVEIVIFWLLYANLLITLLVVAVLRKT